MSRAALPATYGFSYRTSTPLSGRQAPPVRGGRYKPLFRMAFQHRYYDTDDRRCPDLRAYPTPTCADLLDSLGMVFKAERTGFAVYFNEGTTGYLCDYLRRQSDAGDGSGGGGFWTRLTFLLRSVNPSFVDISDLPITTNPTHEALYASNREASRDGAAARFCAGKYLRGDALRPVVGSEVDLSVPARTASVQVLDIAGQVVAEGVFAAGPQGPAPPPGVDLAGTGTGQKKVLVDLSGLPMDLYTIRMLDHAGAELGSREVVYAVGVPAPLCLLDVLFSEPVPGTGGVYPVPPLWEPGAVTPEQVGDVDYVLPFQARATEWRYFVVSQTPGGRLSDLRIEGSGVPTPGFTRQPKPVALPDGSTATLLVSDSPIRLRRVPPQRLRLTGRREDADGSEQEIRVRCLPAAPANPVWPASQPAGGVSEMYVYV